MSRQCTVARCTEPATGYSTCCERHKRAQRRHGHAEQDGITVNELKPFRDRIAARRAKNPSNPAWELLAQRWAILVTHATDSQKAYAAGQVSIRHVQIAAGMLTSLAANVPTEIVVETALAMFILQEANPHRFKSDRAFSFQLARRVRGLAEVNAGTYWDDKRGKVKRVYRDTPPRVLDALAASLADAFGLAGLQLAQLEQRDAQRGDIERRQLTEALKEML